MTHPNTWRIVAKAEASIWSQAIVLQKSEESTPSWYVCISLQNGESTETDGQELIHQLGQTYEQSETKSPPLLLHTLKSILASHPQVNLIGLHLHHNQVTCYAYGTAQLHLKRGETKGCILQSHEYVWKQTTGNLQLQDTCVLMTSIAGYPSLESILHSHQSIESMQLVVDELQSIIKPGFAGIVCSVWSNQDTASTDTRSETPPEEVEQKIPWWKRLTASKTSDDTPEIIQKRRKALYAGWVVLGFLLVSVILGAQTRDQKRLESEFNKLEQKVNQEVAAATAVQPIDQVKARQILRTAAEEVQAAKSHFEKNDALANKHTQLETNVTSLYNSIAAEAAINEVPVWFSLSVVKSGFQGDQMVIAQDHLYVVDKTIQTIIRVNTSSKRAEILAGGESLQGMTAITATGKTVVILKNSGIDSLTPTNKTPTPLITQTTDWQSPHLIGSFNNNVYVVDVSAREIWRYPMSTEAASQRWLGPGVSLPSLTFNDMAIDSDLWFIHDGKVYRYRRGAPVSFSFSGLDQPLSTTTPSIAVATDADKLLVLDQGNSRVVQFDKNGNYTKQFKWSGLSSAKSIRISSDAQTLFVLRDGAVHTMSL